MPSFSNKLSCFAIIFLLKAVPRCVRVWVLWCWKTSHPVVISHQVPTNKKKWQRNRDIRYERTIWALGLIPADCALFYDFGKSSLHQPLVTIKPQIKKTTTKNCMTRMRKKERTNGETTLIAGFRNDPQLKIDGARTNKKNERNRRHHTIKE